MFYCIIACEIDDPCYGNKSRTPSAANSDYCRTRFPNIRLLGIYDFADNEEAQELNDCLKSVRSLEFFGDRSLLSTPVLSKLLHSCSKMLKLLDLSMAPLEEIPKEVFKLFHLKYLFLVDTQVQIIPKSIRKLQNLEFLALDGTKVTELPVEILKLRKLRFVLMGKWGSYSENFALQGGKFPYGIGKLRSLESLGAVEVDDKEMVREIGKLAKLRELFITKLKREDGKEFLSTLGKLTNLETLIVVSITEDEPIDLQHPVAPAPSSLESIVFVGHLWSVPKWVISLGSLTYLYLQNSGLKEDEVEALQVLPNLAVLRLNHAYEGETLSFKAGGFQKLKELQLTKLERLKSMVVEKDSMPSLHMLALTGSKLVDELPFGIENLTNLKLFQLNDMSDELVQKVKSLDKRSEEYQKIAHIPEVSVAYWINGRWDKSFL